MIKNFFSCTFRFECDEGLHQWILLFTRKICYGLLHTQTVIPPANETRAFSREAAGAYSLSSVLVSYRSLIDNKNIAFKRKFSDFLDRPLDNWLIYDLHRVGSLAFIHSNICDLITLITEIVIPCTKI